MGNWNDIHDEISREIQRLQSAAANVVDSVRRSHLKALSEYSGRNTIAYYSSFLAKPRLEGIDILDDDKNAFMTCIHGLDRTKGLDLILHTPGGNIAATESIVHYLREMFGTDIRAIVPQIAMSAGTMLACSCKTIVMGKQSNLGPIDPHINGIPADVVVSEFQRAYMEIITDPRKAHLWSPILSRYTPTFLTQCEYAIEWSRKFVRDCLLINMFSADSDKEQKADAVVAALSSAALNKTHSKHLHYQELMSKNLNIEMMEDDHKFQDLILTVHHCFMHTTANTPVLKIVENQNGRTMARNLAFSPGPPIFGGGSPAHPNLPV